MKKNRGFTLIELLIVIVILAVLASLVLPRMLAQPERAIVAEGVNYLGVIRRAQEAVVGPTQGTWITAQSVNSGATPGAGWSGLGLSPLPLGTSFSYACTTGVYTSAAGTRGGAGTCSATRVGGPKSGSWITMNLNTGLIMSCGGSYKLVGRAGQMGTTCA